MKVICERCGHIFSYEDQDGVCNKCGRYMKIPVSAPVQESKIQKKLHISKLHMATCTILLLLLVIVPIVTVFLTQKEVEHREQLKSVGMIEPGVFQMNEDILIDGTVLRITDCRIMIEWQEFAPEGFQIISVTYETNPVVNGSFAYDTEVYLKLPSNEFVEPIHEYRLAEEIGCDNETISEVYHVTTQMYELTGNFMFLVPDTARQAELAIYYIPFVEDLKTDILDSVYEIELDWRES